MNFAPISEEKQKQSPSVAILSQPNSNEEKTTTKKQVIYRSLCDFYAPNWNENLNKTVLLEILLLFVVLLYGISLIVQCMFFVRYLTATFE